MKKHERILKTYKRNHQSENIDEVEKRKISKEKNHVKKLTNKVNALFNTALAASDDNSINKVEDILYQSKKVAGNLKAHKARLKELQKNDDFV